MRRNYILFILIAALVLVLTPACALSNLMAREEAPPSTPTRTPKPTFTATPLDTPTPVVAPTNTPTATPVETDTPVPTPTPEAPPTAIPTNTPETARAVINNPTVNVRSGPGTNYGTIGQARNGERYDITGKNAAGNWYQINFNGQTGWVTSQYVVVEGDPNSVQVAANIPAAPVPTRAPTRPPQPTPTPQPAQPTPTPRSSKKFNIATVVRCDRQPGGNWFDGTVKINGQPANGWKVVFSYAPDGPQATNPAISGPHPGYDSWAAGFFSHVINAPGVGPKQGNWFVWIIDDGGARVSEIANWQSTGPGEGCNAAVIEFDSR